ncbi:MAG: site-specific integrase [Verrucomicrobia bacterium]|nr:MAG: site-specific integrase [Verrucomicrobiota bacterium]
MTRLCEKIGMKKPKPPYGLRHTLGTDEGASNINQSVLAQLMGHSRLQTTDRCEC